MQYIYNYIYIWFIIIHDSSFSPIFSVMFEAVTWQRRRLLVAGNGLTHFSTALVSQALALASFHVEKRCQGKNVFGLHLSTILIHILGWVNWCKLTKNLWHLCRVSKNVPLKLSGMKTAGQGNIVNGFRPTPSDVAPVTTFWLWRPTLWWR